MDSGFFNRCKDTQKAIKLHMWAWQLIKGKLFRKLEKVAIRWTALITFRTTKPLVWKYLKVLGSGLLNILVDIMIETMYHG